jgi:hypothetical protein
MTIERSEMTVVSTTFAGGEIAYAASRIELHAVRALAGRNPDGLGADERHSISRATVELPKRAIRRKSK